MNEIVKLYVIYKINFIYYFETNLKNELHCFINQKCKIKCKYMHT